MIERPISDKARSAATLFVLLARRTERSHCPSQRTMAQNRSICEIAPQHWPKSMTRSAHISPPNAAAVFDARRQERSTIVFRIAKWLLYNTALCGIAKWPLWYVASLVYKSAVCGIPRYPKCRVWYMALRWSLWYSEVAFVVCGLSSIQRCCVWNTRGALCGRCPTAALLSRHAGDVWMGVWRSYQTQIRNRGRGAARSKKGPS